MCGTYLYVNQRTKFICINMFIEMMTQFQKNSQLARYVNTFILNGRWNYFTRNPQMAHALPQYIAINKINFEYELYKLCVLL